MAIFERVPQTKSILDDTEKLFCSIQNAQNINKHTEYILRVQRGLNKENKWNVSRRYRDFASLQASLQFANIDLPLPPKKLIGNMQPSFVAERQIALQKYIDEVLKNEILALSRQLRCFLDPVNYSLSFSEQALQTVSIALRGDGRYELKSPLPDIGWRIRKHYFLVSSINNLTDCLLSWQSYGVDRYLSDKDLQTAFKSIQSLSHPHIDQILAIQNLETGAYVVRRIHENGSIRDLLYGTEYNKKYLSKYGNPKLRKPFTNGQIACYGYQILQAMKFLHSKGLGHGHIHPGNIAIDNQKAILMDIENIFVGVSSLHRPHLLELKHCSAIDAVDVYSFGRTLYEMALAEPLEGYHCDYYPDFITEDLESVLRLCLSRSSCKQGTAALDTLLYHPFFTRATLTSLKYTSGDDARAHLKFLLPLKAEIKSAMDTIEMRLKSDQKLVRCAKREERIQEILNSEEEIKKQKKRAKKRDSVWKSTSSLAETVRSQSASTASSPTPPQTSSETGSSGGGVRAAGRAAGDARGALLDAICSFDKTRLARAPELPGRA